MPTQTEEFLRSHPRDIGVEDVDLLKTTVERLAACAQSCTACADACLGESEVAELVACVRLNLDCADVCSAAERVLTRRTDADPELQRSLLETAILYTQACARECERHGGRHEHCRLCADRCRLAEDSCRQFLLQVQEQQR
ncbi:four-helix bundle copper-binding protein [Streptomonospora sp. PA3]|uniref:four-helix bundle copper-binding protein n=1 Tax=Streptomonospora sp. PA3 TaxID=2607326 RepID=UPI0012DD3053|nr:four-helix bundle copper-binding protein [Streptomonospora sp. PA3]MUL40469.1 four-helix bundle copper-binding protein [Streptomonospora sp. PA3]